MTDRMYRHSPQARRRETCSITGTLSTNRCSGHFLSPSHLCYRSPQRSIIDPPKLRRYRFSHCFPSIATNTASRAIRRLMFMRPVMVTISLGGSPGTGGTTGVSPGIADLLRVRRIVGRRAANWSFGSGWSCEWTSMTNAELKAENRPAWEDKSEELRERTRGGARKSGWY